MIIYSFAPGLNCAFTDPSMSRRSTQAFSLLEALCMIVTLFVFGWLCVGVIRDDYKHGGEDLHSGVKFTTKDAEPAKTQAAMPAVADPVKEDARNKAETPAAGLGSQPAGSPAPVKP
ncbi:MAG: hypothetical protein JWO94_1378 [Verrucomicrobiaceae bacterium]|nr:hypothetical protein [Verrucomicrobiaceae bacterium]